MAGAKGGRGGQGAAKNRSGGNGGGGATPQPELTDDQKIAAALGTQGTPKTLKQAALDVNPNYRSGRQWQTNCQRCVWAVEMSRRGYDVEAMPRTSDDSYAKANTSVANSFLNVAEGGLQLAQVGSPYFKSSAAEFKAHFTDKYDVGARGMIVGQTTRYGHVFNWEIVQGKNGKQVRFYDGQPNGLVDKRRGYNSENVSVSYIQRRYILIREARMDNAKVTPLIADFVKPKK